MTLEPCQEGILETPMGAEIRIDGREYVNFAGSSYLGLARDPSVLAAGIAALRVNGAGYQPSRAYGVATRAHLEAEREAALFLQSVEALYVASGYVVGLVAMAALRSAHHVAFFDELSHHSLKEAIAASGLRSHAFRHLDPDDLARQLRRKARSGDRPLIVTDGLYATLGEIAPLADFAEVGERYEARLFVDESHAFGVLGATGRGAHEHHGLGSAPVVVGGSTSKGLGVVGGILAGRPEEIVGYRAAPACRGASAGLPAAAAMLAASLSRLRQTPSLRQSLQANVVHLKAGFASLGLSTPPTPAPVVTIGAEVAQPLPDLQRRLMGEGIYVLHSRYIGAGPEGVLRCAVFADHTKAHLDRLLDVLRRTL